MKMLSKNELPGYYEKHTNRVVAGCMIIFILLLSYIVFRVNLSGHIEELFTHRHGKLVPIEEGTMMCDFNDLLENVFLGIPILLVGCIVLAVLNYISVHRDGSIYVFKRVKNPYILHRMCLAVPILTFLAGVVMMVIFTGIYYEIYLHSVPVQYLPEFKGIDIWGNDLL